MSYLRKQNAVTAYNKVRPVVRWAFYIYVFSIPFEYPDRTIPVEVHTITGCIFLVSTFFQPRVCFRRPPMAFWLFAIFIYIWAVLGVLTGVRHSYEFITVFLVFVEGIILFWTAYSIMGHEEVVRKALFIFVISCGLMALALRLGFINSDLTNVTARVTGFGQDPNILGGNMALGLMVLIGIVQGINKGVLKYRAFLLLLVPLLGLCLARTGSRGALSALAVGMLVLIFKKGDVWSILRTVIGVLVLIGFFIWASYHTGTMWNRYEKTLDDGNMAGREFIYPEAWKMFLEKPLTGWGAINNRYELGPRTAEENRPKEFRDTHNVMLEILTSTGILGALPFLFGVWLCVRMAWKARGGVHGIAPFALILTLLVINMNVNWVASKQNWLIFAYALASGSALMRARLPRRAVLSNPRLSPAFLVEHGATAEANVLFRRRAHLS